MAERSPLSLLVSGLGAALLLAPTWRPCAAASLEPSATHPPLEAAPLAGDPPLSADDLHRLDAGEPVVHMDPASSPGGGTGWRILDAPAERLYRAVADWSHYAEFFPFVLASEVTAGRDGGFVVHQRVDLPFPWPNRHFAATTERRVESTSDGRVWRVAWDLVPGSGNVEANRGEWRLRALAPGRTLVALHLVSDAGAVPAGVQRRALEETLPWALDGLRQQVNRCRYDVPIATTCREAPPRPAVVPIATSDAGRTAAKAAPAGGPERR